MYYCIEFDDVESKRRSIGFEGNWLDLHTMVDIFSEIGCRNISVQTLSLTERESYERSVKMNQRKLERLNDMKKELERLQAEAESGNPSIKLIDDIRDLMIEIDNYEFENLGNC